jgi:hypothetical protein
MPDTVISVGGDIRPLQDALNKVEREVGGLGEKLSKFGPAFGSSLTAFAAPLAGIISAGTIKGLIDDFDRIGEQAERLGVTAESMQRIGFQAKFSGIETDVVVKALEKLNRQLQAGNGKSLTALKDLNVDVEKFKGLAPEQKLIELAGGFQQAEASGTGLSQLNELFGKQYGILLPLLRKTKEELQELSDQQVVDSRAIKAAGEFNDALDRLSITARAFGGDVLTGLAAMKSQVDRSFDPKSLEPFETRVSNIARLLLLFGGRATADQVLAPATKQDLSAQEDKAKFDEMLAAYRKRRQAKADADKEEGASADVAKGAAENEAKKAAFLYDQLSALEKLEVIQLKLNQPFQDPADPLRNVQLESEQLDLLKEQLKLKQQIADEEQAFSDMVDRTNAAIQKGIDDENQAFSDMVDAENQSIAVQQSNELDAQKEKEKSQATAKQNLAEELAILEAKARGQGKVAEQLEKEQRIREAAAKIAEETGLNGAESRKLAELKSTLEERAAGRDSGRIRGANAAGRAAALAARDAGGLAAFDERQKTRLADTFQTRALDAFSKNQGRNLAQQGDQRAEQQATGTAVLEKLLTDVVRNTEALRNIE